MNCILKKTCCLCCFHELTIRRSEHFKAAVKNKCRERTVDENSNQLNKSQPGPPPAAATPCKTQL